MIKNDKDAFATFAAYTPVFYAVTLSSDTSFARRFMGRLHTGL